MKIYTRNKKRLQDPHLARSRQGKLKKIKKDGKRLDKEERKYRRRLSDEGRALFAPAKLPRRKAKLPAKTAPQDPVSRVYYRTTMARAIQPRVSRFAEAKNTGVPVPPGDGNVCITACFLRNFLAARQRRLGHHRRPGAALRRDLSRSPTIRSHV